MSQRKVLALGPAELEVVEPWLMENHSIVDHPPYIVIVPWHLLLTGSLGIAKCIISSKE